MIHMTVLVKKKDGMTKEQFDDYWSNTHATIFLSNPVAREKLVKYSQQHIDVAETEKLAAIGAKQPDADGIVHFWARSMDDLLAVFSSDYYKNNVVPDEMNFLKGGLQMCIGVDDDKWADGRTGAGVDPSKWS